MVKSRYKSGEPMFVIKVRSFVSLTVFCVALTDHFIGIVLTSIKS